MGKVIGIFFILGLVMVLTLMFASAAVEISMKSDFSQGETLIAKVTGNLFSPISEGNVVFYRGHVRTSIIPSIEKIDDNYYIYAQLIDKNPNDYSLVLEDIEYYSGNKVLTESFEKNFTITNETADFSIDKGAIVTDKSFSIEVRNLADGEITININEANETSSSDSEGFFASLFGGSQSSLDSASSVTLQAGDKKKLSFDVKDNEVSYNTIKLNTGKTGYEIPVYVFLTVSNERKSIDFDPSFLNISLATNSNTKSIIYLTNPGDADIENISVVLSDSLKQYVILSTDFIDNLRTNSSKQIQLNISSDSEEAIIEGQITATENEFGVRTFAPVFLNFVKDYIPADGSSINVKTSSETCSSLNGTICASGQECTGEYKYATDGVCCLAKCQTPSRSSAGKIFGWFIFIALALGGLWFYLKKYRNVQGVDDLMRILKR
ncbi:hypothetical protein COU59_01155 [Candidatus Pacearchaeota archaeon CG10_big_fil_rev_8_21_14_0_10_34_12]|nr:MAG: hypothetical protein COU59_01155 [Candidatus Pacearchaeota archaeon CG10_big_fil_rev_8_21_14_0_10_34_12]